MLTIARIDATTIRLTSDDADADNAALDDAFEPYPPLARIFEAVEANEHGDFDIDVPREDWGDLYDALEAVGGELPGGYEATDFVGAAIKDAS